MGVGLERTTRSPDNHRLMIEARHRIGDDSCMTNVEEIESALAGLSLPDLQSVRDRLDDSIEDQLAASDEFKAKIRRAQREIAAGVYARTRQPEDGQ